MQTCSNWWVKTAKNRCLYKNVHNFLKNCPQAMLACLRKYLKVFKTRNLKYISNKYCQAPPQFQLSPVPAMLG